MKVRSLRTTSTPRLMIIPMIDIIFFLLVFFMMSMLSMVVQKAMPVSLPSAQTAKVDLDRKLPVTITAEGRIYIEQELVTEEILIRRMQAELAKGSDNLTVILRADAKANYGVFVTVLDTLKKVGVQRISIATDSK